jgi:general secretion pathway protein G
MGHWLFTYLSFGRQKKEGFNRALTLIELLLVVAILGTLSAIAVPTYTDYVTKNNNNTAMLDIRDIESQIERFHALSGGYPATLAAAGINPPNDPWGHAYIYVNPPDRWDKHDKPLNTDYDLLSMGKDGKTDVKLWKTNAADDIIRCNGGAYVGLASEY